MYGQEFGLSRGEKLQFANIHPTAPVDVHLVRTVSTTGCLWLAWQLLVEATVYHLGNPYTETCTMGADADSEQL